MFWDNEPLIRFDVNFEALLGLVSHLIQIDNPCTNIWLTTLERQSLGYFLKFGVASVVNSSLFFVLMWCTVSVNFYPNVIPESLAEVIKTTPTASTSFEKPITWKWCLTNGFVRPVCIFRTGRQWAFSMTTKCVDKILPLGSKMTDLYGIYIINHLYQL